MSLTILPKSELGDFVSQLMESYRVAGPVQKDGGAAFEVIASPDDLYLDYATTILPPKKFFLPTREVLFNFKTNGGFQVQLPEPEPPTIVMGVHTCDVHAIQLLDHVFAAGKPDAHYLQRRAQTLIISIECLKPCDEHAFCKSMGTMSADEGFDLHMIDLGNAYAIETGSEAGEKLIKFSPASAATSADIERLNHVMSEKWPRFPYRLDFDVSDLPSLLSVSMKSPLWEELGKRCLACAACTNVCPTCFCFDVKDEVSLDLTSGSRVRIWDSCQLDEFATVAGGHNFRKSRALRQRHRFMRKGKYILEAHNYLGCVGCGRCARACLVDITPVSVFNELYRQKQAGG